MKAVTKGILAVIIVAALCVLLAVAIIDAPGPNEKETGREPRRPQVTIDDGSVWPMFRGGQSLVGRASGTLPDSLGVVWKFKTNGRVKSSPVITGDSVFVGSSDKSIYALDIHDGRKLWSYEMADAIEGTPCAVENSVYVGCSDGFLYALDANEGQLRWKYETEGEILGAANWTRSPDSGEVWILIGSYDNKLHCVNSADGKAVWTYETDNYINGSPAVSDQKTVFGGCDAMIHVVSLADGSEIKSIDSGSYIAASAAFIDGQVYVGNYDNVFIRADIDSGQMAWKYEDSDSPFFSSPAVGQSVVVVGGRDKRVHCLGRQDGKAIWTFQTLGDVDSSPVICGDKVVVGSEDGRLYMLRLSDGTKVWSYEIGEAVTSSPAVARGLVVVGSDDGYVYAFGPER